MINFSAVTKRFGDGTVALDKVSFQINPGELVVITGPSGSGKTTLMRLLIHDFVPTEGSVAYKGKQLESIAADKIPYHRRKIGVVFQDYRLLSELNVWENIALPLSIMGKPEEEIESRVTDLLNLVNLIDRALVFPKQLSGGEAQRVSIARALATGPSVIFADEPTGNLDKKSSLGIVKLLQQINSLGTTVLIATHDITLLDYLENERHLELDKGELIKDTRPGRVQEKPAEEDESEESEKEDEPEEPEKSTESVESAKPTTESAKKSEKPKPQKKPKDNKEKTTPSVEQSDEKEIAGAEDQAEEKPLADEFKEVATHSKPKKPSLFSNFSKNLTSLKLPTFGKNKKSAKPSKMESAKQVKTEENEEHHE
ncbi:MAG: ATP-binding cassette domain-containing protein [Candidatus Paceibacterota bacterium]